MTYLDEHVVDRLNAHLDRTLSRTDSVIVKQHCDHCASCRAALKRLTAERGSDHSNGWGRLTTLFWLNLAALALVLAALQVHYATLKPSPYDLQVLGQTEWLSDTDAAIHLRFLRHDGKPERGVPLVVELTDQSPAAGRRLQLAKLPTGDNGVAVARFRLPDWPDGPYKLQVTGHPSGAPSPETVTRTVTLKHSWQLMTSTDKPVYQPGQVIHMRGLALRRPDLKPIAGQVMAFSLTDPRGNIVFREGKPTTRFGISSADCPLAGELIEGSYQVDCRIGDTTDRTTVEVRRYVLPRFKVALEFDQQHYRPGQTIKGRVQADYVFGKPVAEGSVTVTFKSTGVVPSTLQPIELHTDAKGGSAPICFARFTQWSRTRWRVCAGRRHCDGSRPRWPDPGTHRDPDRRGQSDPDRGRSRGRLAGQGLAQHDPPSHHHARPPAGQQLLERLRFGHRSEVVDEEVCWELPNLFRSIQPPIIVAWTIQAEDEQGRTVRRQVEHRCGPPNGLCLVRTDKAVYDGSDPVRVQVLAGVDEPVFLDFIKDGQTVLSESIEVARGLGERQIDLPPGLFGTVILYAYSHGASGPPVRRRRHRSVPSARVPETPHTYAPLRAQDKSPIWDPGKAPPAWRGLFCRSIASLTLGRIRRVPTVARAERLDDDETERPVTAAVLVIGDEILSGRTKDRNLGYIAEYLAKIGVDVQEARVVPDVEDDIVAAINALRARYDYLVTTGGIGGPTHDDITADAVGRAFGVPVGEDPRGDRHHA